MAMLFGQMFSQTSLRRIAFIVSPLMSLTASPIKAHDMWADGSPIPAWVSSYCCGIADAHRLTVGQIYHVEGGWFAKGYSHMVPDERVFPSMDEHVWLFYGTMDDSNGAYLLLCSGREHVKRTVRAVSPAIDESESGPSPPSGD